MSAWNYYSRPEKFLIGVTVAVAAGAVTIATLSFAGVLDDPFRTCLEKEYNGKAWSCIKYVNDEPSEEECRIQVKVNRKWVCK